MLVRYLESGHTDVWSLLSVLVCCLRTNLVDLTFVENYTGIRIGDHLSSVSSVSILGLDSLKVLE